MKTQFVIFIVVILFLFLNLSVKSTLIPIPLTKNQKIESIYNRFKNRFVTLKGNKLNVDMVYCIVMPQRKDYITEQINKLGVSCTYFDAVTPDDLTVDDYNELSTINNTQSSIYAKYTRLPVLLSFIMCFMDSLKKGYTTIIIFEDDISINVEPKLLNESLDEFAKSNLDVFYMGYCFMNCGQLLRQFKNLVELSDSNLLCCHSMCIKTRILPGLINYCFPMINNSDEMFRNYYILNKIKIGVPRSVYFTQNRKTLGSLNESLEDSQFFKTCKF